ncbi:hypothetical protein EAF00_005320 [Botryotinia globosa]|nr:hypothetical protein EAF00_005320 [Botryotinia globosa]
MYQQWKAVSRRQPETIMQLMLWWRSDARRMGYKKEGSLVLHKSKVPELIMMELTSWWSSFLPKKEGIA